MNIIPIVEIFLSVQGEGPNVGARCIFVRVKNCDFSCSFCDSKFTWARYNSPVVNMTPDQLSDKLVEMCTSTNCHRVVLTGGNPCIYDDLDNVIFELRENNILVDVETQGSLFPDWLESVDTIVFSPKPPSSGMEDTYDRITYFLNNRLRGYNSRIIQAAIKVPVFNQEDIEFARRYAKFTNEYNSSNKLQLKMYLSVGNSDVNTTESIRYRVLVDYEKLLDTINENPEDFQNVFILPQLHTLIWGNKQGV